MATASSVGGRKDAGTNGPGTRRRSGLALDTVGFLLAWLGVLLIGLQGM
jgi:hypothetical protein